MKMWKAILFVVLGAIGIAAGGEFVVFGAKALAGIHYFYCTIFFFFFFFFFDCFDIALRILSLQGLVSNFTIAAHSFFYSAIT